jgi:large subunit ribosomal protein L1
VNDYEYIVSHPIMVPELTAIRGLIKRKFPMVKNKTISTDLVTEVKRLKGGIKLRLEKNDREPDYGFFEIPIGMVQRKIAFFIYSSLTCNI